MTAPSSQYSSLASAHFTDERVFMRRSPVVAGCPFPGQRADTSDHIDPNSSCLKPTGERACSAPASQRSRGPPLTILRAWRLCRSGRVLVGARRTPRATGVGMPYKSHQDDCHHVKRPGVRPCTLLTVVFRCGDVVRAELLALLCSRLLSRVAALSERK